MSNGKAEYLEWDSIGKYGNDGSGNDSNGKKVDFLRMQSGVTYRIRPVYKPVAFYKFFNKKQDGKLRTAICSEVNIASVRGLYPDLKKPSLRFAAVVIDRADGKVKVLEGPKTIFSAFGNHKEATKKDPGSSQDGFDFQIKVIGKGLNTRYEVTGVVNTPLTKDEMQTVQGTVGDIKGFLAETFKIDTIEAIEKKLFGESEEGAVAPGEASAAAPEEAQDVNW